MVIYQRLRHTGIFCLVIYAIISSLLPLCNISGSGGSVFASTTAGFTGISLPASGDSGGWVLAPGSQVRKVIRTGSGRLYAAVNGLSESLFISDDSGTSWYPCGDIHQEIIDIAVPRDKPETVLYATAMRVYQSTDGGDTFTPLPSTPGDAGNSNRGITSLDVVWLDGYIIAVSVRDLDNGEYGGVYLFDERELIPSWQDSGPGAYDVLDVVFSPGYYADRHLIAAVTDECNTYIFFQREGGGWNEFTGAARLERHGSPPVPVVADSACISFPEGFFTDPASGDAVFYAGIRTGAEQGDVYRILCSAPGSTATDLDVGLLLGATDTDIACLDVSGCYPDATVIAGTSAGTTVFLSTDGGVNWSSSQKSPPGVTLTSVLTGVPGDACFLAATSGGNGGIALSTGGKTWNQISLVSTGIDTILDFAPSPAYDTDRTLFLLTWSNGHSLWKSRDGGISWQRVLWPGIAGVTLFDRIMLPLEFGTACDTMYCAGEIDGVPGILVSHDAGETYVSRLTRDSQTGLNFTIDAWAAVNRDTLLMTGYDGSKSFVYRTDNGGFFFSARHEAGEFLVADIAISPDYLNDGEVLISAYNGQLYLSDQSGRFRPIPDDGSTPFSGAASTAFDPDYANNHYIYAAGSSADEGIYRFGTLDGTEWENIDATLPSGAKFNQLVTDNQGILYAANTNTKGGVERCLVPTIQGPEFDTVIRGLNDGTHLSGLWVSGNHVWTLDNGIKLVRFDDTLKYPVTTSGPAEKSTGLGTIVDHAVKNIELEWDALPGATEYEWQCDDDHNFTDTTAALKGKSETSSVRLLALEPGLTYFWRVRACNPALSPWSVPVQFSTCLDTEEITLKPINPLPGAFDVSVCPLFQWTALQSTDTYELLVSENNTFSIPCVDRTGDNRLPGNAWQCDTQLESGTTYYWKVRACTLNTHSAWSSTGIFTTGNGPETTPETTTEPEGTVASLNPASLAIQPDPQFTPVFTVTQPDQTIVVPSISIAIPEWFLYAIAGCIGIITLTLLVFLVAKLKRRSP